MNHGKNDEEAKIARAALKLAARKPWSAITLAGIAKAAGMSLPRVKKLFPDTLSIIPAIVRLIDHETAKNAGAISRKASTHDRLFEVLMARFDALQSHRKGILSIAGAVQKSPSLALELLENQHRSMQGMCRLAHFESKNVAGKIRRAGLHAAYLLAMYVWTRDDSPDMARTMATLDRVLNKGGQIVNALTKQRLK